MPPKQKKKKKQPAVKSTMQPVRPVVANDPKGPPASGTMSQLLSQQREQREAAIDVFRRVLASYGLDLGGDFLKVIEDAVTQGYTAADLDLLIPELQETDAWKQRFPGWHARVANGYNQLTLPQYLQLENEYKRILEHYGLPPGFYDDPSDFGNWIASNVSPEEVRSRAELAMDAVRQVDPTARELLARFYGVGAGDLAAYFLDKGRALPELERQYKASGIAAWAQRNNLSVEDMTRYEDLADKGVSVEQAASAYGTVAQMSRQLGRIAEIYGESFTTEDAEDDVFFGQSDKRRRLLTRERSTFSGSSRGETGEAARASY